MGMQRDRTRLPSAILPHAEGYGRLSLLSFLTHYLLYTGVTMAVLL
jgi:hypothetical protein